MTARPAIHPSHSFACLDIGTNSVLLLVASVNNEGKILEEYEGVKTTRLGQGLDQTGCLSPEAVSRTLEAVDMFISEARAYPGKPLRLAIVGTSAARDARNGTDFTEPCRRLCGHRPIILTGRQEALATYTAATSDFPDNQMALTLDIGGGSTELAVGVGAECLFRISLDMGCVRFGERFGLFDQPSQPAIRAARQAVREKLAESLEQIRQDVLPLTGKKRMHFLASGGTATSFASLAQSLPVYDKPRIHGFQANMDCVRSLTAELLDMPLTRRANLPGLRKGRGKVLPAGMLILHECLKTFAADSVRISTRGLRFGIIKQMAAGQFKPTVILE